jgi:hypothetical protein
MEKDNKVHRLLGVLISSMELNAYQCEYGKIKMSIIPWYRRVFYKVINKQVSIYEVRGLLEKLSEDKIYLGLVGEFQCGFSHEDLYRFRNLHALGAYKKPLEWWVWPTRIFSALVGLATIIGVVDSLKSPGLRDKITQQEIHIQSLTERIAKDSVVLDSIRDLIETLKKEKPDSSVIKH